MHGKIDLIHLPNLLFHSKFSIQLVLKKYQIYVQQLDKNVAA